MQGQIIVKNINDAIFSNNIMENKSDICLANLNYCEPGTIETYNFCRKQFNLICEEEDLKQ